ncbi:Uncharacterised protein [Psychrobacter phenylpyruvicus]|uniref:Uncharacterized protein n=1 Tax=Psychrobacter phenylpyruvicus TaxID=29432 RepID=A0A379LQT1_9GAMM|nr:Uncharacterised protein [Psychrobacter phenylpyruvicus]
MPSTTIRDQSYLSLIQIPKPSLSIPTVLAVIEPVALARNHKYKQNQYKPKQKQQIVMLLNLYLMEIRSY